MLRDNHKKTIANKKSVVLKKGNAKKQMVGHAALSIALLLALLFSGIAVWQYYFGDTAQVQGIMRDHLRNKYGKEFQVDRPHVVVQGLGVQTVYEAKAYPVDDPSIEFSIESRRDGVNSDAYVGASWQKAAQEHVDPVIEGVFGYRPEYSLGVSSYETQESPLSGEFPGFTDALIGHKSQIGISIRVTAREGINSENKEQVAKRVLALTKHLSKEVAYVSVVYEGSNGGGVKYSVGSSPYTKDSPRNEKSIEELTNIIVEGR